MNKKYLSVVLFGALLLGTAGTFTSCKDYDDDIENLQGQITAMKGTVDQLEQKIKDGLVVTKVEKVADGVSITFSNGQTFKLENGAKGDKGDTGATGAAGKDADVWTIGQDGYWYKNDKPTEYVAVPSVTSGTDGRTLFYKPNTETECFDLYEIKDGKEVLVETTNISYVAKNGLSVVKDGNRLIIKGAVDSEGKPAGTVELKLGEEISSIAFVPELLDAQSKYPLAKFYHVPNFWDEAIYDEEGELENTLYDFIDQEDYDKSNEVKMTYRVSPQRAYVENDGLSFINRSIKQTRAAIANDMSGLLNVVAGTQQIDGEQIVLNATINASKKTDDIYNNFDLAALQARVGAGLPVTSDYVAARTWPLNVYLVDTKTEAGATAGTLVTFYDRDKAIVGDNETDEFVKLFVPEVEDVAEALNHDIPTHLQFKYKDEAGNPGEIDLNKLVGLYGISANPREYDRSSDYLSELGFTGISYRFSLPKEYLAADENNTNQQWFVELDKEKGILRVNKTNLSTGYTPAIGRRPVVRVDAYMTNNAGEPKLVRSSYIRLQIVEYLLEDHDPIQIDAATNGKEYEYHTLENNPTIVANMSWERINREIYGVEHLAANNFWNNYGGADKKYNVEISTYKDGDKVTLYWNNLPHDYLLGLGGLIQGISMQIKLNEDDVTTSRILVAVNNTVKTQNTFDDINGKGAKYEITVTIPANDHSLHSDFKLTQEFYVKDVCQFFIFNPNYYFNTWPGQPDGDYIWVRGRLDNTTNKYRIYSELPEHFKMINNKNIFEYYADQDVTPVKNIKENTLQFKWAALDDPDETDPGVLPDTEITEADASSKTLKLDHDMTKDEEIKQMNYKFELVNGEEYCDTYYQVVFINPFKAADNIQGITLNDGIAQTAKTAPKVLVKDKIKQTGATTVSEIYKWTNNALKLTDVATNYYKLTDADVTVEYTWVEDDNYNEFAGNLTEDTTLGLSADGIVTWSNEGTGLSSDQHLKVKATVKFAGISQVEVIIPVTIAVNR